MSSIGTKRTRVHTGSLTSDSMVVTRHGLGCFFSLPPSRLYLHLRQSSIVSPSPHLFQLTECRVCARRSSNPGLHADSRFSTASCRYQVLPRYKPVFRVQVRHMCASSGSELTCVGSNFSNHSITHGGRVYPTGEHFFQAQKFTVSTSTEIKS